MQGKSTIILFMLLSCATCLGQGSYKGLTPVQSTKADVERVLGRPVKGLSDTLFEYKASEDRGRPSGVDKIFVQYRDESAEAVAERIELVCDYPARAGRPDGCGVLSLDMLANTSAKGRLYADILEKQSSGIFKTIRYYGSPSLLVRTWSRDDKETIQSRLGFYSPGLFDNAVPRDCTGTFLGEWETNRGRLTLVDIPGTQSDDAISDTKGSYSMNNGTVTGRVGASSTLIGEWKDATGGGTFEFKIDPGSPFEPTWPDPRKVFTGSWERMAGKGPKKGTWEGKCVEK